MALRQCVYMWEADMETREDTDFVMSVAWVRNKGNSHYIAVGKNHNVVQLWDTEAKR